MPKPQPQDDANTYQLYDELDRLEELLEDMAALQVQSAIEAEARIAELNTRIDALEESGE